MTTEQGIDGVNNRKWCQELPQLNCVQGGVNISPVSKATQNSGKSKGTAQVLSSVYRTAGPNSLHWFEPVCGQ